MTTDAGHSENGCGPAPWAPEAANAFDHAKAAFEQNFQQFRHLNEQMNRVPAFAVTLTGGFWYVAVVVAQYGQGLGPVREHLARWGLMVFAGLCDFALVCIAIRIRDVMDDYLIRVKRFEGDWWIEKPPSLPWFKGYSMISMYSILMIAGALISWAGSFILFWPSDVLPVWYGALFILSCLAITLFLAYLIPRCLKR